jgi:hypothetical protein
MNDLLIENDHQNIVAKIGKLNISLISFCDDLIILSTCVNHVNKILQLCSDYAKKWKLVFNTSKCNWYVHGKIIIKNPLFLLNQNELRKVERTFYSLYSLGCNNHGLNCHTISSIYKKFCQSIFYYGLETNFIRKKCLNKINVRQNTLLKNIFGLSKFCRSRALMSVLKIKSTNQLYEEYKILFLKQIKRNSLTKQFFEVLQQTYNVHLTPPK